MANIRMNAAAAAGMASFLNMLAGAWLIISPFVLDFRLVPVPMWNTLIAGVIVAASAAARAYLPHRAVGLSWLDVVLGIWLIVSPFALGYTRISAAMGNAIILGVVVALLGLWSAVMTPPVSRRLT
jgi:hypothetical protein